MKQEKINIVGYGELVFDHLFVEGNHGEFHYKGSRGGGSLWNLLLNLSGKDLSLTGIGCCGDDLYGSLARTELSQFGVDVTRIQQAQSMSTRVIFQLTEHSTDLLKPPRHDFSAKCRVCSNTPPDRYIARTGKYVNDGELTIPSRSIVCLDRFTHDREKLVSLNNRSDVINVIDLGRIGYLRWISSLQILSYLGLFDIVQLPISVAMSLKTRARLGFKEFLKIGRIRILCITQGEDGVTVFTKKANGKVVEKHDAELFDLKYGDTSGAGDAFLAAFLYQLICNYNGCISDIKQSDSPELINDAAEKAVRALKPILQVYGARGHLHKPRVKATMHGFTRFRDMMETDIKEIVGRMQYCPFCGMLVHKKEKRKTIKKRRNASIHSNVANLLKRVFSSFDKREAIEKCSQLIEGIHNGYVIGTGGSYPAATFIAQLLSLYKGKFMQAAKPLEYCKTASKSDCLIVISYSGRTKDCERAIAHAVEIGVPRIGLVTATENAVLASLLRPEQDYLICYGEGSQKERGFVSIAGTVSPCALWTATVKNSVDILSLVGTVDDEVKGFTEIKEISTLMDRGKVLHVFGSGMAYPAMLDIESKVTEGGLGIVQLHESKDFSHGRFILVFSKRHVKNPKILIRNMENDPYEDRLEKTLRKLGPLLTITTRNMGPIGALELLIEVQFLVQKIAMTLEVNISRPNNRAILKEGKRLYKW